MIIAVKLLFNDFFSYEYFILSFSLCTLLCALTCLPLEKRVHGLLISYLCYRKHSCLCVTRALGG